MGTVYGKKGKDHLKKNLAAYNQAARYNPWCVLLDLDQDADCAPLLCSALLPEPGGWMCLRIVVRSIEAWLMADCERLAGFFSVPISRIPTDVEVVERPKETLINLAARSRRRAIQEDMVPRAGSGRSVGPGYTARIIEFVKDQKRGWRPLVAAAHADSLRRCLDCLRRLGSGY